MEESNKLTNKYLSGSALKWIAIATMFIDHIGAFLISPFLIDHGVYPIISFSRASELQGTPYYKFLLLYIVFRLVGRLAFPIFTFLLVEGFLHTHNLKKYIFQLGIFALISEIPFDLAHSGLIFESSHQNVFFTLFIGLVCIAIFDKFEGVTDMRFFVCIVGMYFSEILNTDYSAMGVLAIFIFYYFRDKCKLKNISNGLIFSQQLTAPLALIPIYFYNGERGKQNKFFFYIFYPAHLILLFFLRGFWFS